MQNRPGDDGFTLKVVLPNNDFDPILQKKNFKEPYFTIFWSKNTKKPI